MFDVVLAVILAALAVQQHRDGSRLWIPLAVAAVVLAVLGGASL